MSWYKKRRDKGLCVCCEKPSETFRCEECKRTFNAGINAMRAERRAAGLCAMCGSKPCLCNRKKKPGKLPPKDSIPEQIAIAISGINTRSDHGYWELIDAVKKVLDRYGIPHEKRSKVKA